MSLLRRLKNSCGVDVQHHVQIAGRAVALARFALAAQPDLRAVVHARRNLDTVSVRGFVAAMPRPPHCIAGRIDHFATSRDSAGSRSR